MKAFAITVQDTHNKDNILTALDQQIKEISANYHSHISDFINEIPLNLKANTLISLVNRIVADKEETEKEGQHYWRVQDSTFILPHKSYQNFTEEQLTQQVNKLTEEIVHDAANLFTAAAAISAAQTADNKHEYIANILNEEKYYTVTHHNL